MNYSIKRLFKQNYFLPTSPNQKKLTYKWTEHPLKPYSAYSTALRFQNNPNLLTDRLVLLDIDVTKEKPIPQQLLDWIIKHPTYTESSFSGLGGLHLIYTLDTSTHDILRNITGRFTLPDLGELFINSGYVIVTAKEIQTQQLSPGQRVANCIDLTALTALTALFNIKKENDFSIK